MRNYDPHSGLWMIGLRIVGSLLTLQLAPDERPEFRFEFISESVIRKMIFILLPPEKKEAVR